MQPKVIKRTYKVIESTLETRGDLISKKYSRKITTFKEATELLFYLSDILNARFYDDYKKTGKQLDNPRALIQILFDRNNHYLIAAYKLASHFGLINPCYLNLRTVFEGIMQIYLLHLTEREGELFYKKQLDLLTPTEKKEFNGKYERLRPARVRKILYTGTKKEKIDTFYEGISNSTHPSVISAMNDFILRDEPVKDTLDLTLVLSAANAIAIHEAYFDRFDQEEVNEIINMLDKIANEIGGFMIDMVPNRNFNGKLKIVL